MTFHTFSFLLKPPTSPHPSLISAADFASYFTDEVKTLWRQSFQSWNEETPSVFVGSDFLPAKPSILLFICLSKACPSFTGFYLLSRAQGYSSKVGPFLSASLIFPLYWVSPIGSNTFHLKKCALEPTSVCSYHSRFLSPLPHNLQKNIYTPSVFLSCILISLVFVPTTLPNRCHQGHLITLTLWNLMVGSQFLSYLIQSLLDS